MEESNKRKPFGEQLNLFLSNTRLFLILVLLLITGVFTSGQIYQSNQDTIKTTKVKADSNTSRIDSLENTIIEQKQILKNLDTTQTEMKNDMERILDYIINQ